MPDEPNKKMDEMLRAYARERRKNPEVNLHPATRRMLQGEVARVIGRGHPGGSWIHRLRSYWPQIIFAGSLCLVFGIAVLSLRHHPREEEALERKPASAPKEESALTPTPPAQLGAPVIQRADDMLEKDRFKTEVRKANTTELEKEVKPVQEEKLKELVRQAGAVPGPNTVELQFPPALPAQEPAAAEAPVSLQDKPQPTAKARSSFFKAEKIAAPQLLNVPAPTDTQKRGYGSEGVLGREALDAAAVNSASPRPEVQLLTSEKLAAANEMTNLGAARRFQFVQMTNASQSPPATLLTSFQVEQLGNDIRFVDRDGSVYLGGVVDLTNQTEAVPVAGIVAQRYTRGAGTVAITTKKTDELSYLTNAPFFSFRASGTNRTLGKNVVITGQYFEQTNAPATSLDTFAVTKAGSRNRRPAPGAEPQQLIIGTAIVGASNTIPLRAVSRE